jgi:hypothetical protein
VLNWAVTQQGTFEFILCLLWFLTRLKNQISMARNKNKSNRDPLSDDFGSWEAAAEFWDTHDLTDYEDTERDVPDVQINLVQHHFRVDRAIAQRLHQLAFQRGISPETLVNLWLAEKLQLDKPAAIAKKDRHKRARQRAAIQA